MQTIYEASILLVDDNPDLLVLVGDSLRTAGYTCIRTAAPRRGRCFDPAAVKTKRPLPENSGRGRAIYKLGAVG